MMKILRRVLFVLMLGTSFCAFGQGCPPGQYPVAGQGWNYCAPVPAAAQDEAQPQRQQGPRWENHWQATAIDTGTGVLGTSLGRRSADDAEHDALMDCRSKGGARCEVQISMVNGCVAMVVGDKLLNTKGAETKAEALSKAMKSCADKDRGCHVYYSSCDLPELVQPRRTE